MSKDRSLFIGDGTNLYNYSRQDSINRIDLDGRSSFVFARATPVVGRQSPLTQAIQRGLRDNATRRQTSSERADQIMRDNAISRPDELIPSMRRPTPLPEDLPGPENSFLHALMRAIIALDKLFEAPPVNPVQRLNDPLCVLDPMCFENTLDELCRS